MPLCEILYLYNIELHTTFINNVKELEMAFDILLFRNCIYEMFRGGAYDDTCSP